MVCRSGYGWWLLFELHADGVDALLISESWCRIVGGSGQRHEITKDGSRLVTEGFA
jgi:hypothetical protein